MMEPNREPLSDDAVVALLRDRAPGLPPVGFDPRAVTVRARDALRRLRRRRIRNSTLAGAGAAAAYLVLVLVLAGPLPVPGLGPVSVPGGDTFRGLVRGILPGVPPGPGQWDADVDRLEAEVMPVVDDLHVYYYLLHPGPCRVMDYSRGDYSDGGNCGDGTMPLDARALADFNAVTEAVERSGVAVERIYRDGGAIYIPLQDYSWQYNWEYVHLSDVDTPPPARWPGEEWTHIRGDWWFHRAHDD